MAKINQNYEQSRDEHGLAIIEETGRCLGTDAADIEADCTRKYQMTPLPNASGAILKSMDGTQPRIIEVEPPTLTNRRYRCVKVDAYTNPLAPEQTAGTYSGSTILQYYIRWQEVGDVA